MGDRMTDRAGDARRCRRISDVIKVWIVECTTEEGHRIVAAGAKP